MKKTANQQPIRVKRNPLGSRAFEAITAVEGLKLSPQSRQRLKALQQDKTLTPDQRRAAVIKAYATLSRKK